MIPRPLSEIDWADIEALIQLNRQEDDRIEFKNSFKGSDDYSALNDNQRQQVLDSLAREAIAFLNTRGGDVIVGVEESEGPSPTAASIRSIKNPSDAADRVARGLAAVIEPAQTNISVRGVTQSTDSNEGILIIRVEPSVRAPHRSKRTRDCYARRGSESVPMAMDEIQDLTINRTRLRLEQMELIERQFADFVTGRSEHRNLGNELIHIRTVAVPTLEQSFTLDDALLGTLSNKNPVFYTHDGKPVQNDVAFRNLYRAWQPVLRGKKQENHEEYAQGDFVDFQYARRLVKESGVTIFDYAVDSHWDSAVPLVYSDWIIGYFAEVAEDIRGMSKVRLTTFPCTIRVGIRSKGSIHLAYGASFWGGKKELPEDTFFFPDFTIESEDDLDLFFRQAQIDLFSLVNIPHESPYSLREPSTSQTPD